MDIVRTEREGLFDLFQLSDDALDADKEDLDPSFNLYSSIKPDGAHIKAHSLR